MSRIYLLSFLFWLIQVAPLSAQKGYVKRADRLMSNFRFAEAAELYTKEIKSDTNDLVSMAKLANAYTLMDNYERAETVYAQLTAEPLCLPVNWFTMLKYFAETASMLRPIWPINVLPP